MTLSGSATEEAPSFPPLLRGEAVRAGQSVLETGIARAERGIEPGLVIWANSPDHLAASMILAPEVALADALPATFALMLGLGDALGALAPPEVAVHFDWPGGVRVNGARCGTFRAAASTTDLAAEPDWLVVALEMPFRVPAGVDPGADPTQTWLWEEGCAELSPHRLLESWARHGLVWLNRWMDEGFGPLHQDWTGRAWRLGEPLEDGTGTFVGLDEQGNRLVRTGATTVAEPLTRLMEAA